MSTINWFGAFTLLKKEIWRFLKVYHQTLFSPVVNIMLFFAIFSLSLGNHLQEINNTPFPLFVAAGLIMMASMQNAFANSSSSIVMGKVMGHYIDYVIPPLETFELLFAFIFGAILRGILVSIIAIIAISFFIKITFSYPLLIIFYLFFACMFLAMLGVLCGIVSNSFDQMSAITNYVITPFTFLSGTFYSTNSLPEFWQKLAHLNPFFYMIDGFRYAITSNHDGNLTIGMIYILSVNVILFTILCLVIKKSYRN